jgi:hypothetical protein
MSANAKSPVKRKIIGTILTIIGCAGLVYAGMSQFAEGMDKRAAAGTLLFSLIIVFIGISQLYKKDAEEY